MPNAALRWCLAALPLAAAHAVVIDRIAVIVDNRAIKQSDLFNEIRLTDFINGDKLNFGAAELKKAASRLIDQAVIRKEIEMGGYGSPDSAEVEQLMGQVGQRYPTEDAFRRALAAYGLTESQLEDRLRWQVRVLQFVNLRFGGGNAESAQVNQEFFSWLDETRKQSRIVYLEESLK